MNAPDQFLHFTATGWAAIGSITSALSVVALAVFNGLFLKNAVRATNAAKTQAEAATEQADATTIQAKVAADAIRLASEANQIDRDTLQQQQRPWVGLDQDTAAQSPLVIAFIPNTVEVGPIEIDKDGTASASFSIRCKNFGAGPAQSVLVKASLMVTEDLKDIEAEQLALTQPNQDRSIGLLLFPNTVGTISSASSFPSSRMKSMTFDHLFEVWLIGVVHYWDRFGNHYYTGFRYWMIDSEKRQPFRFSAPPNTKIQKPFWPHGSGGLIK